MENRTKTIEQRIDWIGGQIAALGVAVHGLIRHHPKRDELAQHLHAELERMYVSLSTKGLPDETLRGFDAVRDSFLMKKPEDPGQPSVR